MRDTVEEAAEKSVKNVTRTGVSSGFIKKVSRRKWYDHEEILL